MIQQRILQYLETKGLSKYQFYKHTGLSNGFLDKKGSIGSDKCELICSKYPELNLYWLVTGHGNMLNSSQPNAQQNTDEETEESYLRRRARKKLAPGSPDIPVYDANTRGGFVTVYADDSDMQKPVGSLSTEIFPGCDHAERVTGDSMYPMIINQAIVVGKKVEVAGILWGEKYGIHTKYGLSVVKFIHPGNEKGMIKLVSYNKSVPEQDINLDDVTLCFRILYIINPA